MHRDPQHNTVVSSHSPDKVSVVFECWQSTRNFHSLAGCSVSSLCECCAFCLLVLRFFLSWDTWIRPVSSSVFFTYVYILHVNALFMHIFSCQIHIACYIYMCLNICVWNVKINKVIENVGLCYLNYYWVVLQNQTIAKSFEMCLNLQNCHILPQTLETSTEVEQDTIHLLVYLL